MVGRAAVLPRALTDGVLVDLRDAQSLSDPANDEATSEVWLAPNAPADIEQRLTAQGITVLSREHLADTRQLLLQQGNTRGATVALWIALAGLLTTLLTVVGSRAADAARRRADWLAFRDAGIPPPTIRLLAFVEIAAPNLIGAGVGLAAGLAAIRLGGPKLPLVDMYLAGPPLDLRLAATPIIVIAAAASITIVVIAALGALWETRSEAAR